MNVTPRKNAEIAYARIKAGIVQGEYQPGEKLSEARLITAFGLNRSAIRSGLVKLESEGWIRIVPQSGSFVRDLSLQNVNEITEIRILLEAHAARSAALHMDTATIETLRRELNRLLQFDDPLPVEEFIDTDHLFHSTIWRSAGNGRITTILEGIRDEIFHWIGNTNSKDGGGAKASVVEMLHVLDALESRDGQAAARAMSTHLENIARTFRSLRSRPDIKAE